MGVSKNRGTPKWWFKMENLIKMDDLGVPLFLETPVPESFFHLLPVFFPGDSEATEHHHGVMSLWLMTAASLKSEGLDSEVLI